MAVAAAVAAAAFHKQFLCLSLQRKKPEKERREEGFGKFCIGVSLKILAIPLCFISEG